jgi:hypothetical protein
MLLTLGLTVGEIGAAIGRLLKRLVYAFDSDYIEIPQANLIAGDAVEFKFISEPVTNFDYFFDGTDSVNRLYLHTGDSRKFNFSSARTASIQLDGGTLVTTSNTLTVPEDGLEHTMRVVFSDVGKIGKVAGQWNAVASDLANLPIYDFSITAASGDRFYAINDNSQNIKNALDTSTPRFRYDFDPTASATIPPLALEVGDVVSFKFVMDDLDDIANKFFMAAQDGRFHVSVANAGTWNLFGSSGHTSTIDGNPLVQGTTHFGQFADGREHVIQITLGASVADVVTIASSRTGGQDFDGIMYDVEFTAAAGNRFYAMDDNSQTIANALDTSTPRFRYELDGVYDYVSIPEVNFGATEDFILEFTVVLPSTLPAPSTTYGLAGDTSGNSIVYARNASINFQIPDSGGNKYVSVDYVAGENAIRLERSSGSITLTNTTTGDSDVITPPTPLDFILNVVGRWNSAASSFQGAIYNLDIQPAASGNRFYAIDDNSQTLVDSVSGQDGTIESYDAASWEFGNLTDGTIENYGASSWEFGNLTDGTIINYDPTHWVRNN